MKRFLYLTQSGRGVPKYYNDIVCERADLVCLSFKKNGGTLYRPNTTWTEGRNYLWDYASQLRRKYEYYIFLDDDIVFKQGSWRDFEDLLDKHKPIVGFPHGWDWAPKSDLAVHTNYSFDAMMNAFSADAFFNSAMLPYFDGFDHHSWHLSQLMLIHFASMYFYERVLMFRNIRVRNEQSRSYPRSSNQEAVLKTAQNWLLENAFRDESEVHNKFKFHPQVLYTEVPVAPAAVTPINTHRNEFRSHFNLDNPFWKRIGEVRRGIIARSKSAYRFNLDSLNE